MALPTLLCSLANGNQRRRLGNLKIDWYGTLVNAGSSSRPGTPYFVVFVGGGGGFTEDQEQ